MLSCIVFFFMNIQDLVCVFFFLSTYIKKTSYSAGGQKGESRDVLRLSDHISLTGLDL